MALNWQSLWEIRGREGLQDHVLQSARQILSGCCRGSQRRSLVQRRHLLGSRAVRWSCSSRSSRIPSHPRNDAGHLHLSASGRLCPPEGCDNCDPLATFCSRRGDLKAWLVFLTAKLAQGWQVPQISSWLLLLFLSFQCYWQETLLQCSSSLGQSGQRRSEEAPYKWSFVCLVSAWDWQTLLQPERRGEGEWKETGAASLGLFQSRMNWTV